MSPTHTKDESWARTVLGLGPRAGRGEVQQAFRMLSKTRHPDLGGSSDAFEELLTAYEILRSSDSEPLTAWITGDEVPTMSRFAWDSRPKPKQRTFRDVFADALRQQRK